MTEAGLEALADAAASSDAIEAAVHASLERIPMSLCSRSTRDDIADYVGALFLVYLILIFIADPALVEFRGCPTTRSLRAVVGFVQEITDPYLNLFRRLIPPLGGRGFALDLSPIIAIIAAARSSARRRRR